MSEQHLRPGPGEDALANSVDPSEPRGTVNPWELREDLGVWRALWRATVVFLGRPIRGFLVTQRRGGFRGPLLFALLVSFIATFIAEFFDGLYQLAVDPQGSGNLGAILDVKLEGETLGAIEWLPASLLGAVSLAGCFWALVLGLPVFVVMFPLVMLAWTAVLHLCLKLVGGLRESDSGYQGTWAAVCYATVGFIPGVIPVIGDLFAFLWLGLLQGLGFWILHRTTPIRATLALLLPFVIPLVLWLVVLTGVLTLE